MKPTFALNLFSDPECAKMTPGTGMPCKIGTDLFKSLLAKENRSFGETKKSQMSPGANGKEFGAARVKNNKSHGTGTESVADDLSIFGESGLLIGLLKMPPKSATKLITFLQGKGLSREKALALVKSATEKDGFIRVDRLMAGLGGLRGAMGGKQEDLMIASRDVPQVQKLLSQMGLGAGEVKSLSEQSDDGKGNMILSKLVAGLAGRFPKMDAPENLATFFAQFGIKCCSSDVAHRISAGELKAFMHAFAETSSEDAQKHIKTVLAQLLREKGVPPEKVKSFLEGINVTYAKNVSGNESAKAGELGLWDGLVLRQQHKMQNDPWTEKILAILKDARTGAQQVDDKKGTFLQSFFPGRDDQLNLTNKSVSERLASLIRAGEEGPSSKGQRNLKRQGFDGRISFSPGETFLKTAGQGPGADRVLHTSPHAGIFARTLDYAQGASPVSSILDRMQWMMKAGRQHARIQLSPPELGHIDLRLVIDQGHLQAHLGTENPMVKEMIEANLDQLKQQLAGLGFVVDEFSVHVGADGRDFMDQHEMWGKTDGSAKMGWNGETDMEALAEGTGKRATYEDDHYQVNVRV